MDADMQQQHNFVDIMGELAHRRPEQSGPPGLVTVNAQVFESCLKGFQPDSSATSSVVTVARYVKKVNTQPSGKTLGPCNGP